MKWGGKAGVFGVSKTSTVEPFVGTALGPGFGVFGTVAISKSLYYINIYNIN